MSQRSRDTGRNVLVAVKRGLKLGQKRSKQINRKVSWTNILTELPQKMRKKM